MANPTVKHRKVTGVAANPRALVDGPAWDDTHVVTGLENVDNTSDANKPVSTAQATAIAAGVASVTKTSIGLGNVDNTSDANKPLSTADTAALALKAPLASPALTGTPTAPTAAVGTHTTQIATTGFVNQATQLPAVQDLNNVTTPGTYYTLDPNSTNGPVTGDWFFLLVESMPAFTGDSKQTVTPLQSNNTYTRTQVNSVWSAWRQLAATDSPTFTGVPTAPTAAVGTNTAQLATTAYLKATSVTLTPTGDNIIGGSLAGSSLTSSASNILIGKNAGKNITSGTGENVVIGGTAAGISMTTATQNTIVGSEAGGSITGDTGHTLIGYQAGLSLNGNAQTWNTFVGHSAGFLATGAGSCVAFGRAAGRGMLNDVACAAIGHASFFFNNGGVCSSVSAFGGQSAGAPVDGTGTNWQGTGLTYWGAINDTRVAYIGDLSGKSSAAARTNATALGPLARLPLKDNVVVLGHGVTAVETAGNYWDSWNRTDITGTTGLTVTAAQLLTGLVVRAGALAAGVNDTTDTAANIVTNGPGQNCEVPCSLERSYGNLTSGGFTTTIVGGSGVAVSSLGLGGAIAPGILAKFRIVITNSTPGAEAVTLYRIG